MKTKLTYVMALVVILACIAGPMVIIAAGLHQMNHRVAAGTLRECPCNNWFLANTK